MVYSVSCLAWSQHLVCSFLVFSIQNGSEFISIWEYSILLGLSALQYVDLRSSRNLYILGLSLFFPLVLCQWMQKNPGLINTGIPELDSTLSVLLSTTILVGGCLGCLLDNLIPGIVYFLNRKYLVFRVFSDKTQIHLHMQKKKCFSRNKGRTRFDCMGEWNVIDNRWWFEWKWANIVNIRLSVWNEHAQKVNLFILSPKSFLIP